MVIHASKYAQPPAVTQHALRGNSLQTLLQDVLSLSQQLTLGQRDSAPSPAVIEAFQAAKYSLTIAVASIKGRSTLLEKEVIASNQKSLPKMAKRMGAK